MSTSRLEDASRNREGREDDLIDRWLDEGDRLSENARTTGSMPVLKRRWLAEGFAALGALADRRRFTVVVVVVGVSALAIVGLRAASHAVLRTDPAVAAEAPPARPAAAAPLPAPAPTAVPTAAPVREPQPAAAPASALAAAPPDPEPVPAPAAAPAVAVEAAPAAAPPDPAPAPAATSSAPSPAAHAVAVAQAAPASRPPSAAAEPELPAARTKPVAAASASDQEECQAALRRERTKPALVACEKFSRENPASADALVMLAHANLLAGSDGETLRLARRASFLDPKNADAYLLVGTVLQTMGRMPAARSAYQSYLQNAPHGSHAAEVRAILKTL